MLRVSVKHPGDYSLSIKADDGSIKHFRVHRVQAEWRLMQKTYDGKGFTDVIDLVEYYRHIAGSANKMLAAAPRLSDLDQQPWYSGALPKAKIEKQLQISPEGTYTVRKSDRGEETYTLAVRVSSLSSLESRSLCMWTPMRPCKPPCLCTCGRALARLCAVFVCAVWLWLFTRLSFSGDHLERWRQKVENRAGPNRLLARAVENTRRDGVPYDRRARSALHC